jgi:DHA2 family multidrug resistance protein
VLTGLICASFTLYQMTGFTDQTSAQSIVNASILQGFGIGLVFVPLSTVAFASLPGYLRTEGTAILTLVRNIGSSVGISMVIANLTNSTIRMHAQLAEHVTPFNNALAMPDARTMLNMGTDTGRALMDQLLTQQASIIAYANDFKLLMWLTLASIPAVVFIGSSRVAPARKGSPPTAAHALD